MSFTLYIGEDCHDCQLVVDFIRKNNLEVTIENLDKDHVPPPVDIYIRPALFHNGELVGYGVDSVAYLKKEWV